MTSADKKAELDARAVWVCARVEAGDGYAAIAKDLGMTVSAIWLYVKRGSGLLGREVRSTKKRGRKETPVPEGTLQNGRCQVLVGRRPCGLSLPCEGPHLGIDYYASERMDRG